MARTGMGVDAIINKEYYTQIIYLLERTMPTKTCNTCHQDLDTSLFSKNKARKDGLDSKCRSCMKIKQKAQYDRHEEKRRKGARNENLTQEQIEHKREYNRKYREEHKEALIEHSRQWRMDNPDYIRPNKEEYDAARAKAHRERYNADPEFRARCLKLAAEGRKNITDEGRAKRREYQNKYRWGHVEQDREYKNRYYAEYRKTEKYAEYMLRYREDNAEKLKADNSNYRAKRGFTSNEHVIWLHKWQDNHCYWCNRKMAKKDITVEHIVPISKDGSANNYNVVLACRSCNFSKQDRLYGTEWLPDSAVDPEQIWSRQGRRNYECNLQKLGISFDFDEDTGMFTLEDGALVVVASSFWASDRAGGAARDMFLKYKDMGVNILWDAVYSYSDFEYVNPEGLTSSDSVLERLDFYDDDMAVDDLLRVNGVFKRFV
jgi:5-methylcytosine-specific restriction endonuclease McrA